MQKIERSNVTDTAFHRTYFKFKIEMVRLDLRYSDVLIS